MLTRVQILSLALLMLLPVAASANTGAPKNSAHAPAMVRLPGHVLPALSHAAEVNQPVDARGRLVHDSDELTLTIVLKRDDQPGFDRYLKDIYQPH